MEDKEQEAKHDKDCCPIQEQFAESFEVTQAAISERFTADRYIQKVRKLGSIWVQGKRYYRKILHV